MGYRLVLLLMGLGLACPAGADEIVLTDGERLDGIVTSEEADTLEVQLGQEVFIVLERTRVREVVTADAAGREALRERWAREQESFLKSLQDQEAFEASQREKGFVQQGGRWLTQAEFDAWERAERLRLEEARIEADREIARQAVRTASPSGSAVERGDFFRRVLVVQGIRAFSSSTTVARQRRIREIEDDLPLRSLHLRVRSQIYNRMYTRTFGFYK